jgi:hypothetical protein
VSKTQPITQTGGQAGTSVVPFPQELQTRGPNATPPDDRDERVDTLQQQIHTLMREVAILTTERAVRTGGEEHVDYQDRYLDLLQEGIKDIKAEMREIKQQVVAQGQTLQTALREHQEAVEKRLSRTEDTIRGERQAIWGVAIGIGALVVATVWGALQYAAALLQLIRHP